MNKKLDEEFEKVIQLTREITKTLHPIFIGKDTGKLSVAMCRACVTFFMAVKLTREQAIDLVGETFAMVWPDKVEDEPIEIERFKLADVDTNLSQHEVDTKMVQDE